MVSVLAAWASRPATRSAVREAPNVHPHPLHTQERHRSPFTPPPPPPPHAEFAAGRAQNYLLPEHAEKIVSAYREFADIPGYATVVTRKDLAANDDNLNIRRYADNAPPPEPQDVRAHLHGGVPRAEVDAKAPLFTATDFPPTDLCRP